MTKPLTDERLFGWHAALFPPAAAACTKSRSARGATIATGPMQVVSGADRHGSTSISKRRPPHGVAREMKAFLDWFNAAATIDPVLKAGARASVVRHRSTRSMTAMGASRALSPTWRSRARRKARSASTACRRKSAERKAYYDILEATQKGDLDVTAWLEWFLACLDRAFDRAEATSFPCSRKIALLAEACSGAFNDRQRDMINRLLEGFEGKLTNAKWAKIEKCSERHSAARHR